MLTQTYSSLLEHWPDNAWARRLVDRAEETLSQHVHGDLPRWREALQSLPDIEQSAKVDLPAPRLGQALKDPALLRETLMSFHPWRKGPFELAGVRIDPEWRSDLKWERVRAQVDLRGHRVLDIGSGNGYFGWRMLAEGARLVVGIDPTLVYVMQWLACRHFAGKLPNYVLPLGVEDLPPGAAGFDSVFSMGVIYHRRNPLDHLSQIQALLKPGGTLVLETLVLPEGEERNILVPKERYARMRNVWAVPSTAQLLDWVRRAGFESPELVDVTVTTPEEQRSTPWMKFESLAQALDPEDQTQTIEGYPAPTRAVVIAHR